MTIDTKASRVVSDELREAAEDEGKHWAETIGPHAHLVLKAADALDEQAKRIAELEAENTRLQNWRELTTKFVTCLCEDDDDTPLQMLDVFWDEVSK